MLRFRGESPAARRDTSLCMPPTPPAVDALTASVAFSVAPALWTAILICGPAQLEDFASQRERCRLGLVACPAQQGVRRAGHAPDALQQAALQRGVADCAGRHCIAGLLGGLRDVWAEHGPQRGAEHVRFGQVSGSL